MPIIDGKIKKIDDKHQDYEEMINKWQFWGAAYNGEEKFLEYVITRNERESPDNFDQRLEEGEVFNYCETIVDLFCNFLSQQQVHRDLSSLANNESWLMFEKDVDLYGTDYNVFWHSAEKLASVYGFVGILIDKPKSNIENANLTRADELSTMIYPYFSLFIPENIHDWEFIRSPITARPELVYLKLKEDNGYLVWTAETWERWELKPGFVNEYQIVDEGINELGEIPFIWHSNFTNLNKPYLGISDIKGTAKIQAAITRDLSNGSEIIKYAAFPMMRKPNPTVTEEPTQGDDTAGVTVILGFDKEFPGSKPDWLEAKVKEPIDAILSWIDKKIIEIYRTAHLSNMHGQSTSASARSGVALKYEYQQLASVLTAKGQDMDEAELKGIYYWLKWQNLINLYPDITINRPSGFNIDDLSIQLDNCLIATTIVKAETFSKALQKKIARLVLPDETSEIMAEIDDEIEAGIEEEPEKELIEPEEEPLEKEGDNEPEEKNIKEKDIIDK